MVLPGELLEDKLLVGVRLEALCLAETFTEFVASRYPHLDSRFGEGLGLRKSLMSSER